METILSDPARSQESPPGAAPAQNLPRSLLLLVAALTAILPLSIEGMSPVLPSLAMTLAVPRADVAAAMSAFVIAFAAGSKTKLFGKSSPYIETVCYSMTFFFHLVPAITETATRLPLDAPLATSPDDPNIQMAIGACLLLFILGAVIQVRLLSGRLKALK